MYPMRVLHTAATHFAALTLGIVGGWMLAAKAQATAQQLDRHRDEQPRQIPTGWDPDRLDPDEKADD